jgi:hypothetical protein
MCRALAVRVLGDNVQAFGDGPDGSRELMWEGNVAYPGSDSQVHWSGYGVLQAKFSVRRGAHVDPHPGRGAHISDCHRKRFRSDHRPAPYARVAGNAADRRRVFGWRRHQRCSRTASPADGWGSRDKRDGDDPEVETWRTGRARPDRGPSIEGRDRLEVQRTVSRSAVGTCRPVNGSRRGPIATGRDSHMAARHFRTSRSVGST